MGILTEGMVQLAAVITLCVVLVAGLTGNRR